MKYIKLTQGKYAIVDDEDFEYLNQFKWYASKNRNTFYAKRNIYLGGGSQNPKSTYEVMHRVILNISSKQKQVDHRNHNGLDNRRQNIRICTASENGQNRKSYKNTSSKYKGVSWHKKTKKWVAHITVNKKLLSLGYFKDEHNAARAYNNAAISHFGEYAYLNFKNE